MYKINVTDIFNMRRLAQPAKSRILTYVGLCNISGLPCAVP